MVYVIHFCACPLRRLLSSHEKKNKNLERSISFQDIGLLSSLFITERVVYWFVDWVLIFALTYSLIFYSTRKKSYCEQDHIKRWLNIFKWNTVKFLMMFILFWKYIVLHSTFITLGDLWNRMVLFHLIKTGRSDYFQLHLHTRSIENYSLTFM